MITFSRALARSFHQALRKAGLLNRPYLAGTPFVRLIADAQGLTLQSANEKLSVALMLPHAPETEAFAIPAQLLAEGSPGRTGDLSLSRNGKQILARWTDRGVPDERDVEPIDLSKVPPLPPPPTEWTENPPPFVESLRQAMASTDPDSLRSALGCVQLDGAAGALRATDGRQALVQSGFRLPWTEAVLIPGTKLLEAAALPRDRDIQIGRTSDQVVLRIGPWTIAFMIQTAGRFPDIPRIIPAESVLTTRVTLDPADVRFLADRLDQLPHDDGLHHPVTLDLNGSVAVRSRRSSETPPTELVLGRSRRTGDELRLVTDRRMLSRALKLGFTDFGFKSADSPVVCRDATRQFVWMPLDSQGAVPSAENGVRLDSLQQSHPTPRTVRRHRPDKPKPRLEPAASAGRPPACSSTSLPYARISMSQPPIPATSVATEEDLIGQLLDLRRQLQSAECGLIAIARQLRARRKQQQLVKSTLASLKQLQTLGV